MFQQLRIATFGFFLFLPPTIQNTLCCAEQNTTSITIEITAVLQRKDILRRAAEWGKLPEVRSIVLVYPDALTGWYRDRWEPSPLHGAAKRGHTDIVHFLVEHGAPVNHQDGRERTSLHEAAEQGHLPVIELLTQHRADPNVQDVSGITPLHLTATMGALGIIRFLINNDSEIDMTDGTGETLLFKALKMQDTTVVEYLLKHFAAVGDNELDLLAREYPAEYLRWLRERRDKLVGALEEQLPRDLYNLLITFVSRK